MGLGKARGRELEIERSIEGSRSAIDFFEWISSITPGYSAAASSGVVGKTNHVGKKALFPT